jgi:outer membrane protein assembly factor BamE (lipoprotein component of BamABCDE complex)
MRLTQKHLVYLGLATIAVVSVFILYIGYVSYSPINRQAVARIQPLMTEQQVEEILGSKCKYAIPVPERRARDKVFPAHVVKMWGDDQARCIVTFDAAGLVERAGLVEASDPGIIARVRMVFGVR